jgi:hypothetical protein
MNIDYLDKLENLFIIYSNNTEIPTFIAFCNWCIELEAIYKGPVKRQFITAKDLYEFAVSLEEWNNKQRINEGEQS